MNHLEVSALLRRTTCLIHTSCHTRFFRENVDDVVSGSAGQYSANIVVLEEHLFTEHLG